MNATSQQRQRQHVEHSVKERIFNTTYVQGGQTLLLAPQARERAWPPPINSSRNPRRPLLVTAEADAAVVVVLESARVTTTCLFRQRRFRYGGGSPRCPPGQPALWRRTAQLRKTLPISTALQIY
ncbi:unnamed protein product, partial [Ectocarpus sp. 12 AP-2014]